MIKQSEPWPSVWPQLNLRSFNFDFHLSLHKLLKPHTLGLNADTKAQHLFGGLGVTCAGIDATLQPN